MKVRYNGLEGYVQAGSFDSNCKQVGDKWGNNPYSYSLSFDINVQEVTLYNVDSNMTALDEKAKKSNLTINNIYGYCNNKDGEMFSSST